MVWYLGALSLGAAFAWLIVEIFRKALPAGTTRSYWTELGTEVHGLLYGDADDFWRHYGRIIAQTIRYVARQLFAIVVAFVPLVVALLIAGPWLYGKWDGDTMLSVFPEHAGIVTTAGMAQPSATGGGKVLMLANGRRIELASRPGSQVICPAGHMGCLLLMGFGYAAISADPEISGLDTSIILRTAHDDWNPLWPYLNDPEFLFFSGLSLTSLLLFMRKPRSASAGQGEYSIGLTDYALLQLVTRNIRAMRKLGDWETRRNRRRITGVRIVKPVFIAGLARSGTTVLLEKLASIDGVATHRYRDFPFIMTPVLWNGFLSLFGGKQESVERPHRDGIHITRESPDAFEEPIWQHFFPGLHDATKSHVVHSAMDAPEFVRFYREHISKILMVRKGSRYVSKGNYNLPRIGYISNIFPDARFLIPVRHPLMHCHSLVREHRLFLGYAERDPRVAEYLESVGHYEFGPQRRPICLTVEQGREISAAWERGDDMLGYAIQWAGIYGFVMALFAEAGQTGERMRVIRFEDLCDDPQGRIRRILDFIELGTENSAAALAKGIRMPTQLHDLADRSLDAPWRIVEDVARRYGYTRDPDRNMERPAGICL